MSAIPVCPSAENKSNRSLLYATASTFFPLTTMAWDILTVSESLTLHLVAFSLKQLHQTCQTAGRSAGKPIAHACTNASTHKLQLQSGAHCGMLF
eukprot:scaffold60804_cov14-Tisochrysis_lutea.AAC.1